MTTYSKHKLRQIFDVTDGFCHLCGSWLWFSSYGRADRFLSWEVEHGNPLSRGGTNDLRNLKPACISCNRKKGDLTTSEYRRLLASAPQMSDLFRNLTLLALGAYAIKLNRSRTKGNHNEI